MAAKIKYTDSNYVEIDLVTQEFSGSSTAKAASSAVLMHEKPRWDIFLGNHSCNGQVIGPAVSITVQLGFDKYFYEAHIKADGYTAQYLENEVAKWMKDKNNPELDDAIYKHLRGLAFGALTDTSESAEAIGVMFLAVFHAGVLQGRKDLKRELHDLIGRD